MKMYKGYSIELIDGLVERLYQIYDENGYYRGQAKTIKEAKDFINDYLM